MENQAATLGYAGRDVPAPPESSPTLAPFIERVLALSCVVNEAARDINNRADRLFGSVPSESKTAGQIRSVPPGEFGRLGDALDTLDNSIQRLQAADQRLSQL